MRCALTRDRFEAGQKFLRHYDGLDYGSGVYTEAAANEPLMSVIVVLADDFRDGLTAFFDSAGRMHHEVTCKRGSAMLYPCQLMHEDCTVSKGVKYVLRTEVLYAPPSKSLCSIL
jgi:prolyl 4-hydroxylase